MQLVRFAGALLAIALCAGSAHAINKCTGPDGRVSFQDAPCAGKGEVFNPRATAQPPTPVAANPAKSASAPQTEAQRLEGIVSNSQRKRRAQDLRDRYLPLAEDQLRDHRAACERAQEDMAAKQYIYQQNLYGKTHAAQMASEMAAAAVKCQQKEALLKDSLEALAKECAALTCRS